LPCSLKVMAASSARQSALRARDLAFQAFERGGAQGAAMYPTARGSGTNGSLPACRWLRRRWKRRRFVQRSEANSSSRRCFISTEVRRSMKRWVSLSCSASDSRSSTARVMPCQWRRHASSPGDGRHRCRCGSAPAARQGGDIAFGDIGAGDLARQPVIGNDSRSPLKEQEDVAHQLDMLVGGQFAEVGQLADIPQPATPRAKWPGL
jgi:hypothetical protein